MIDGKSESARARCLECGCEGPLRFLSDYGDDPDKVEAAAGLAWNTRVQRAS